MNDEKTFIKKYKIPPNAALSCCIWGKCYPFASYKREVP